MVRAMYSAYSARGKERGGQITGKCGDHCGEARARATLPGYCGRWHGDYGREHHARQQHGWQQEHALLISIPVHYTSFQRSSCMPQQSTFRLPASLFSHRLSRPSARLYSVHGRHGGLRPRMNSTLQEEGNENGQALVKALSLVRDSALPEQFRFGNTSDNAPFGLLSWIWIRAFFSRFATGERSTKSTYFQRFSHFRPTPLFPQHNKAQHYQYLAVAPSLSPFGHVGMAFFLFCGQVVTVLRSLIPQASELGLAWLGALALRPHEEDSSCRYSWFHIHITYTKYHMTSLISFPWHNL